MRVAVAVLTGIAMLLSACTASQAGPSARTHPLHYDRQGLPYGGPGQGDGGGLRSHPGSTPVIYHGVPVIQACALMTPEDVAALGLTMIPSSAAVIVDNTHLGRAGEVAPYSINNLDGPNHCSLMIGVDDASPGSISIIVQQPAYATAEKITQSLEFDYGPGSAYRGVTVYPPQRPNAQFVEHWLRYHDVSIDLTVGLPDHRLDDVVLDAVIDRLKTEVAAPHGPLSFDYDSPAFPLPYVNACAVTAWSDVVVLTDDGPGASIREHLSSGIGLVTFDNGLQADYVEHSCARNGGRDRYGPEESITTTTYDSVEAAVAALAGDRRRGGVQTPQRVGDESVMVTFMGKQYLMFRRGRTAVMLDYFPGDGRAVPTDRTQALLTIARPIAARIPAS